MKLLDKLLHVIFAAAALVMTPIVLAAGLEGYDPVSYFAGDKPVKGSEQFVLQHQGETYLFSSADNRERFAATPDRYLPQYGGQCAWAVAQGKLAPGNASVYKVVEGKLYLNFNQSVASRWEKDVSGNIRAADDNWPKVKK